MFPQALGAAAMASGEGATLIVSMANMTNSGSTLGVLGALAGDVLLAIGVSSMSLNPGNVGMTANMTGGQYKLLTSGDLSLKFQSDTAVTMLIYRGCASVSKVVNDTPLGFNGTRTPAGFTKHAKHMGIVCGIVAPTGSTVSVSKPASFTQRGYYNTAVGNNRHLAADRLYPVNPPYVSGTPSEWSCSNGGQFAIFELRAP